ncbi:MAG: L,D-transpeptidase family protein [Verrucomicrobiaceae bacterium]|nr:L,D-transpeptidase family protein [Verrucomicrobiaceae bacterium]
MMSFMGVSFCFLVACSVVLAESSDPVKNSQNTNDEYVAVINSGTGTAGQAAEVATNESKQSTEAPTKAINIAIPETGAEAVRLQIFLDQKHFGPGFIDGKVGMFTQLAIENYNTSLGRDITDRRVIAESIREVPELYASAIIPSFVGDFVDPSLPQEKPLQAEKTFMPYRSVAEFMAERYHTSEDLLIELNGMEAVWRAKPRDVLRVPNIEPFKIEQLTRGRSHKSDENLSARHVVIDTTIRQVYIYQLVLPEVEGGQSAPEKENAQAASQVIKVKAAKPEMVASFPITPGQIQFIPKEWRYDKLLLETGVRGSEYLTIPPGPNNPVGVIWNGLTKSGIGIHGTNHPRTIGRTRSSGCIRLSNWDAAKLPELVRPGAVVMVK